MTNEHILLTSLNRAFDNGLDWLGWSNPSSIHQVNSNLFIFYMPNEGSATEITMSYQEVIFNHDFAKAFWGEELREIDCYDLPNFETEDSQGAHSYSLPAWQYHLQQLALAEEPLKYLERFLMGEEVAGAS